jgi:predicted RNase H-like HicB family nuclease
LRGGWDLKKCPIRAVEPDIPAAGDPSMSSGHGCGVRLDSCQTHIQMGVNQRVVKIAFCRTMAYTLGMSVGFTAVFKRIPEGYAAYVEELPGANTQGATIEEARENLREAVELVLDANRALARQAAGDGDVIREPLRIVVGGSAATSCAI